MVFTGSKTAVEYFRYIKSEKDKKKTKVDEATLVAGKIYLLY